MDRQEAIYVLKGSVVDRTRSMKGLLELIEAKRNAVEDMQKLEKIERIIDKRTEVDCDSTLRSILEVLESGGVYGSTK